ncbi:hypothetical protein MTR67_030111 [Solanum verrucosum]|uniref:Anthocyanin acyltransferase n=1 Tax=Solanum verrucosum TaxID=315347 RepID=A0AAF0TXV4_SOLVR|nr:hypothetical protein MTR67_030111 [Solanum verrucosum]
METGSSSSSPFQKTTPITPVEYTIGNLPRHRVYRQDPATEPEMVRPIGIRMPIEAPIKLQDGGDRASGRFAYDGQSINCHDEGVLYIKAKVDSQFCDFLTNAQKDIDLALSFYPKIDRSVSNLSITPLVVVQVTLFACGKGLALSVSSEHTVIDGFTSLKFVYEWSKVSKMGINIHSDKINCFTFDDFGTIFLPTSENHLLTRVKSPRDDHYHDFAEMVARRFVINQSTISKLRENVGVVYFRPSRVELVIAFLWRVLINVYQCKSNGRLRPCLLSVPVNLRDKIDFPRYENSFGNFAIEVPVKFIPGET